MKNKSIAALNPPGGGINPFSGNFDKAALQHLLRRTLFGASKADINHFSGKSLSQVVAELLTVSTTPPDPPIKTYTTKQGGVAIDNIDPNVPFGTTWVNTAISPTTTPNPDGPRRGVWKGWWMGLMVNQDRNLREKMTLFWHNHLATEADVINIAIMIYRHNALLRQHALGNFKTLMQQVTVDCAMLRYLNGEKNSKTAPDENYGREMQELFMVGKGPGSGYTEDDVKAAARVLTGWQINNNNFVTPHTSFFNPNRHDTTDKQFSAFYGNKIIKGKTGATAGTDEINEMIDMILSVDEVSKFICRKLYTFFVYYTITPEIEANVIEPLAQIFRDNNYEIKPVLSALFQSEHFFDPENRGCMIKSPVDFVVGQVRELGLQLPDATKYEAQYKMWNDLRNSTSSMGQDLGDPPNVAGWPAYYQVPQFHEIWVDTTTYPVRKTTYETLTKNGLATNAQMFTEESKNVKSVIDYVGWAKKLDNPSDPNALIDEAVELLYGVGISQEVKDDLKTTYLLQGQASDYYWTDAFTKYVANPNTTDPDAKKVPAILKDLLVFMQSAAEYHLC